MKRTFKSILAVGSVIGAVAPSAFAGLTATLYVQSDGQPSGYRDSSPWGGGEFTAVLSGNSTLASTILSHYSSQTKVTVNGQTGFETFCVENSISFKAGTAYNAALGSTIVPGNTPGTTALVQGVAWLYAQFATGQLSGYDYTPGSGREASAYALQNAIWYLEGEVTGQSTDQFVLLAISKFGSLSTAEKSSTATGASNYGVDVLNLSSISNGCTVYAQDQLVYCPVPEPATIAAGASLLLPFGLTALRFFRSRKSNG